MSKGYIVCIYESINDDQALKNYANKAREAERSSESVMKLPKI